MLLNCGVGEDSWESLQPVHPKGNQSWVFTGRTDVEAETPTFGHLMRRADSFEKTLMLGKTERRRRRGQQRGWYGWMAPATRWTWVWASSRRWWWTGKPGMLQSMGSHRLGHDWNDLAAAAAAAAALHRYQKGLEQSGRITQWLEIGWWSKNWFQNYWWFGSSQFSRGILLNHQVINLLISATISD